MVQGFSDEARASLSACYTPAELTSLERLLATPTAGLHIRCNELQSSREELLDELRRQPQLQGFRVEPHPILRDVAFVPRKPRAAALAPYLALDADPRLRGPQRRTHSVPVVSRVHWSPYSTWSSPVRPTGGVRP